MTVCGVGKGSCSPWVAPQGACERPNGVGMGVGLLPSTKARSPLLKVLLCVMLTLQEVGAGGRQEGWRAVASVFLEKSLPRKGSQGSFQTASFMHFGRGFDLQETLQQRSCWAEHAAYPDSESISRVCAGRQAVMKVLCAAGGLWAWAGAFLLSVCVNVLRAGVSIRFCPRLAFAVQAFVL